MTYNRMKNVVFGVCTLFSFLFYGLGFRVNYQPDIYGRVAATGNDLAGIIINRDGRILSMLIMFVLHRISFTFFYYASLFISIVLITASTYEFALFLNAILGKVQKKEIELPRIAFVSVISCITIANMFSAEFFLYIDMAVAFTLAILLSVKASIKYIKLISGNSSLWCPAVILLLFPVSFLYETISTLFVVLSVPFIVFFSVSFSDFLKKQIAAGLYYAFPLLIKSVYTRFVLVTDRGRFDQPSIVETVKQYTPGGIDPDIYIIDRITFGMYGYALLSFVVVILIVCYIIRNRRWVEFVKGIYITSVICIAGLIPYILRLTNDYKPRIYYPLGTFFGCIIIYGLLMGAFSLRDDKPIGLSLIVMLFVGIQWLSFLQMYVDCYITNYEDKYISEMIGAVIDKYEIETGNEVKKVVFYNDAQRTKYSIIGWCLTQRAYSGWTETQTLNMYLKRNYAVGEHDNSFAEYFGKNDWNCFSEDQIVIEGDTAHICEY